MCLSQSRWSLLLNTQARFAKQCCSQSVWSYYLCRVATAESRLFRNLIHWWIRRHFKVKKRKNSLIFVINTQKYILFKSLFKVYGFYKILYYNLNTLYIYFSHIVLLQMFTIVIYMYVNILYFRLNIIECVCSNIFCMNLKMLRSICEAFTWRDCITVKHFIIYAHFFN